MASFQVANVLEWSISPSAATHPYASQETSGWKKRVVGTKDWTGTFRALYEGDTVDLKQGDRGTFYFIADGTVSWAGSGVVQNVTINAPIDDGGPLELTGTIEGIQTSTATPVGLSGAGTHTAPFSVAPNAKLSANIA